VPADLLDSPDVGAGAGGSGHEARAQAVPGVAGGVEPGGQRAHLHDAGDGVAGQAGIAHPVAAPRPAPYLPGGRWPIALSGRSSTCVAGGPWLPAALPQRPLRANDNETLSPREFSLEGAEG